MANKITASLADIEKADFVINMSNRSYSKGALAIHGTNLFDALTAAAVTYSINGILYTKAAMASVGAATLGGANGALDETCAAATMTPQLPGFDAAYLLLLDAAGTVKATQGASVATGGVVQVPGCPPLYAPFGLIKVRNASGSNFVFGTTVFNAAGVTTTFFDVSASPGVI